MISDKLYNVLKWIAQIVLPAMGTLYFGLAAIWGFPYGEQVVGTITVIDAFLGAVLGVSAVKYTGDGVLHIDTSDPVTDKWSFDATSPLNEIQEKKTVVFQVKKK